MKGLFRSSWPSVEDCPNGGMTATFYVLFPPIRRFGVTTMEMPLGDIIQAECPRCGYHTDAGGMGSTLPETAVKRVGLHP